MDSSSFKKQNIIIDCKLKGTKHIPPNINKLGKNKIKKIKYLYVDSSEKTKDETWNKLEKNNDNKSKKPKENNQKKKFSLMDKSPRKKQLYNYLLNDNSDLELTINNPKISFNYYNFKNFNKDSFSYLLNFRAKTLENNDGKKYKIKLNILNNKEIKKKDNSNKQKSNYNINSFNEDDLINKIKNINYEKYITNCYKNVKVIPDDRNNLLNDKEQIKNSKKRHNININNNNIYNYEKTKNLVPNDQSKMKAYTHMSEKIKINILEKTEKKKDQKKQKIKNSQKNNSKKLNIDIRRSKNNYSNSNKNTTTDINQMNNYSSSNKDNIYLRLNLNSNDTDENENDNDKENNDCLDVPQRRPGCSTKKSRNEIFIETSAKIDHEKLRKSELLIGLQPRTTFTKVIKRSQKLNNINDKIMKQKERSNLTNKLINSIIKKFRTQRFNISSYNKIKNNRNKFQKKKEVNYINFINIQEKLSKTLVKKEYHFKNNKELNFALLDNNLRDNSSRELSLKNHSFSRGFNTIDYNIKNKRNKNSVIKRINHYIKNEKILTNNYKKSFTDFHMLANHHNEDSNEKE